MICTPSIAQHQGIALVLRGQLRGNDDNDGITNTNAAMAHHPHFPHDKDMYTEFCRLLHCMGGYLECTSLHEMNVYMTGACVMGPLYALMQTHVEWMVSQLHKDGGTTDDSDDSNTARVSTSSLINVAHNVVTKQYAAIVNDALVSTAKEEAVNTGGSGSEIVQQQQQRQQVYTTKDTTTSCIENERKTANVMNATNTGGTASGSEMDATSTKSSNTITRIQQLLQEQTPNGINEQAKHNLMSAGVMTSYTQMLDTVLTQLQDKTT
jgi:hypothetical protein